MKNVIFLSLALGMMLYAVPRLPVGGGASMSAVFAAVWLCMALLVVAAHLHDILGVDDETRRELTEIRRLKSRRLAARLQGRRGILPARK